MVRWEKPFRSAGSYEFPYKDNNGTDLVVVHRSDDNGSKRIWQNFPTIDHSAPSHKVQLQEIKAHVLPYKYKEAIEESERSGLPIIIVEGELTCQSVWAIGLPSVTFLGGSKQYRTNGDYSHLFKKHKIVLAPDRDEQGVAFMREIETVAARKKTSQQLLTYLAKFIASIKKKTAMWLLTILALKKKTANTTRLI